MPPQRGRVPKIIVGASEMHPEIETDPPQGGLGSLRPAARTPFRGVPPSPRFPSGTPVDQQANVTEIRLSFHSVTCDNQVLSPLSSPSLPRNRPRAQVRFIACEAPSDLLIGRRLSPSFPLSPQNRQCAQVPIHRLKTHRTSRSADVTCRLG
jgi:hypothetical protein